MITQAVLLFGCCTLHFVRRPSSADPQWGSAHNIYVGSGGEMRLRINPPSFPTFKKKFPKKIDFLTWLKNKYYNVLAKIFHSGKKVLFSKPFSPLILLPPPAALAAFVAAHNPCNLT